MAMMNRLAFVTIIALVLAGGAASASAGEGVSVGLALEPAQQSAGAATTARFHFACAGDHYVQKEGLRVELADAGGAGEAVSVTEVVLPEARRKRDEVLGELIEYFDGEFTVDALLRIERDLQPGDYSLAFTVTYQACRPGFCLLEEDTPGVVLTVLPPQEGGAAKPPRAAATSVEEAAGRFAGRNVVVAVLLSFLAGLGLTLTPCIYPLIPVTVSLVGATSGRRRLDGFVRSVVYVFGLSVTYSAVGVLAAATGGMFGAFLQNPIVYLALAAIFVLLAAAMFDWYSLDIVSQRLQSFQAGLHGRAGLVGVWLVGLLSGAAATSCVAPIIVGIFVYVGQKGSLLLGFLMFFALAWGIGTPLVVLGTFTGLLKGLPKSGEWMLRVKHFFGLLLLAVAVYFLGRSQVLPPLWYTVCLGAFLLGLSVFVGAFDQLRPETGAWQRFRKAVGLLLFVAALGVFMLAARDLLPAGLGPAASQRGEPIEWLTSEPEALQRAEALDRPLLLDFWTEDCPACVRMLEETFRDPRVVAEAERFVFAKIDLTDRDDASVRRLQEKYDIRGVPLVVLVGTDGTRRSYAEYIAPERMVRILESVR